MSVVTKYGQGYQAPDSRLLPEAIYTGNPQRPLLASFAIENGDSATSQLLIGKIPSHAILLPTGLVTHTAITGLTDFDIGILEDPDMLADGLNLSSAGTKSPVAAVSTPNLIKPLWSLLGLARDPARQFTVVATLKVDAGAAGTIHIFQPWVGKL